jgi:hypothetical protein
VLLDAVTTEILGLNCEFSPFSKAAGTGYKNTAQLSRFEVVQTARFGVTSEHNGGQWAVSANQSKNDPGACEPIYTSSYNCCGEANESRSAAVGPHIQVGDPATAPPGALMMQSFVSARTVVLLHDSVDATRQMLGRHQIPRRLTPWVLENILEIHPAVTGFNTSQFDVMLAQAVEVGFESIMLDQNLGPPGLFELNSTDPRLATVRANARKANAAGVAVGACESLCSCACSAWPTCGLPSRL